MISIVKMLSPDFPWVKNNPLDIKNPWPWVLDGKLPMGHFSMEFFKPMGFRIPWVKSRRKYHGVLKPMDIFSRV